VVAEVKIDAEPGQVRPLKLHAAFDVGLAAAIANAVYNATGNRLTALPLNAEAHYAAGENKSPPRRKKKVSAGKAEQLDRVQPENLFPFLRRYRHRLYRLEVLPNERFSAFRSERVVSGENEMLCA
jgi:hypothetical protein